MLIESEYPDQVQDLYLWDSEIVILNLFQYQNDETVNLLNYSEGSIRLVADGYREIFK